MNILENFEKYVDHISAEKLGLTSMFSGGMCFAMSLVDLEGFAEVAKNFGIIITSMVAIFTGCKFFIKEINEKINSTKSKKNGNN